MKGANNLILPGIMIIGAGRKVIPFISMRLASLTNEFALFRAILDELQPISRELTLTARL
jgi:hypothetical protein